MAELFVCRKEEFAEGCRIVTAGSVEVGVFRYKDGYVAYRNLCPHQGGPACEGVIIPRVTAVLDDDQRFVRNGFDVDEMHFVCPWHGYEFKLANGECAGDPALRLRSFELTERDGNLYVRV